MLESPALQGHPDVWQPELADNLADKRPVVVRRHGGGRLPLEAVDQESIVDKVAEDACQHEMACGIDFHVAHQPHAHPRKHAKNDEQEPIESIVRPGHEQGEGSCDTAHTVQQQCHLTWTETSVEQPVMKMVA